MLWADSNTLTLIYFLVFLTWVLTMLWFLLYDPQLVSSQIQCLSWEELNIPWRWDMQVHEILCTYCGSVQFLHDAAEAQFLVSLEFIFGHHLGARLGQLSFLHGWTDDTHTGLFIHEQTWLLAHRQEYLYLTGLFIYTKDFFSIHRYGKLYQKGLYLTGLFIYKRTFLIHRYGKLYQKGLYLTG